MLFNSLQFLAFFPAVLIGFWFLRRTLAWRNSWLLVASYVFYAGWDWRFLGLILLSTVVDYSLAIRIEPASPKARKALVAISLVVNLGVLGIFKYLDFGIETMSNLLATLGIAANPMTLEILLPVGISFYTFQTIGYTVDVARGLRPAERNFRDFALYVAYFPQLVAGPIERSTALLPQIKAPTHVTGEHLQRAFFWTLTGYFLKVVVADSVAPFVDEAYANYDTMGGPVMFLATVGFAVQIFGDFAGYTLIARGISQAFGISLMENFRAPYLSVSPRDFWRRWHISLSTWLRDYLYIPLGGNRHGPFRKHLNVFIVFTLCGLWHGAAVNFVFFGAYWGALLVVTDILSKAARKRSRRKRPRESEVHPERWNLLRAGQALLTFLLTMVSFAIFRSPDLPAAWLVITGWVSDFHLDPSFPLYLKTVGLLMTIIMIYGICHEKTGDETFMLKTPLFVRCLLAVFLLASVVAVGFRPVPFFYFQF